MTKLRSEIGPGSRGIFGVIKPVGPSSHAIVNQLRRLTGEKRVGHAGTLDPLASGVLVVAVGREFTKQLSTFVEQEKEYEAEFTLGVTSTTQDAEGEKEVIVSEAPQLTIHDIDHQLRQFVGLIEQVPPAFSAVKIGGTPAYKLARRQLKHSQELITPPSRLREVKSIELLEYHWPLVKLKVITGKGVYIRSLARDLGSALGTGAYMSGLVRTRVGQFTIENGLRIT